MTNNYTPTPTPSIDASMRKQKGAAGSQLDGAELLESAHMPSRSAVLTNAQLLSAANNFFSVVRGEPCRKEKRKRGERR